MVGADADHAVCELRIAVDRQQPRPLSVAPSPSPRRTDSSLHGARMTPTTVSSVAIDGDRDAPGGHAVDEGAGPVDRIHHPEIAGRPASQTDTPRRGCRLRETSAAIRCAEQELDRLSAIETTSCAVRLGLDREIRPCPRNSDSAMAPASRAIVSGQLEARGDRRGCVGVSGAMDQDSTGVEMSQCGDEGDAAIVEIDAHHGAGRHERGPCRRRPRRGARLWSRPRIRRGRRDRRAWRISPVSAAAASVLERHRVRPDGELAPGPATAPRAGRRRSTAADPDAGLPASTATISQGTTFASPMKSAMKAEAGALVELARAALLRDPPLVHHDDRSETASASSWSCVT